MIEVVSVPRRGARLRQGELRDGQEEEGREKGREEGREKARGAEAGEEERSEEPEEKSDEEGSEGEDRGAEDAEASDEADAERAGRVCTASPSAAAVVSAADFPAADGDVETLAAPVSAGAGEFQARAGRRRLRSARTSSTARAIDSSRFSLTMKSL